ncbi:MAG: DUF2304 family protein [Candidatus Uhrbacteria bacterium]|nr:DUF2304 family protein [Patescibacteria group bacterium]MBU1906524.1 DUF2304 family protein [Patescibacteria group bacterium]
MTIQIVVTIIIAFILIKTGMRYRKKEISTRLFAFWVLFWVVAGIFFWMPELSDRVAKVLEVGRGVDAIVYISLVILFYALFKIFNRFERMERELTKLVREIAILEGTKVEKNEADE